MNFIQISDREAINLDSCQGYIIEDNGAVSVYPIGWTPNLMNGGYAVVQPEYRGSFLARVGYAEIAPDGLCGDCNGAGVICDDLGTTQCMGCEGTGKGTK